MNSAELKAQFVDEFDIEAVFESVSKKLHKTAKQKGFYDELNMATFNSQAKQLMMITSEVVEVMEALRKERGEYAILDEISDILIRVFDFYESLREASVITDNTLGEVFNEKARKNKSRPKMHGVLG